MLSLHRMRSLLVKFRTMQINQLRGLLYEFGVTFRAGRVAGLDEIRERMAELEDALPRSIVLNLLEQSRRINLFEEDINQLEKRIGAWQKQEAACRAISEVPGIGRLTATALVATIGDAKAFKSGREFAAFLGLVPRQNGTGGKIRLGSISRRGEPYWRPPSSAPGGGLGLGLYIWQQIVQAHHGTLEACSTREDGTCFTARIPINP